MLLPNVESLERPQFVEGTLFMARMAREPRQWRRIDVIILLGT